MSWRPTRVFPPTRPPGMLSAAALRPAAAASSIDAPLIRASIVAAPLRRPCRWRSASSLSAELSADAERGSQRARSRTPSACKEAVNRATSAFAAQNGERLACSPTRRDDADRRGSSADDRTSRADDDACAPYREGRSRRSGDAETANPDSACDERRRDYCAHTCRDRKRHVTRDLEHGHGGLSSVYVALVERARDCTIPGCRARTERAWSPPPAGCPS